MQRPEHRNRPRSSVKLLALLGSTLLTLLLTEAGFRAWYAVRDEAAPHRDRSTASEWTWAKRHLESKQARLPAAARYDPSVGWLMTAHQDAEGVRTNSQGIRSEQEFTHERAPGRRRILFVGDSYTFGAGVANAETFQAVLEAEFLPDWDVINYGVSGHGPDQTLLVYQQIGRAYRPDIVVFGLFERGVSRIGLRFRAYLKPWFSLEDGGALRVHGSPVMPPEELYALYASGARHIGGLGYSYAVEAIANAWIRNFTGMSLARNDRSWQLMAAILRDFQRAAHDAGSQPLLLIFPDRPSSSRREQLFSTIDALAREEARELDLPVLSLRQAFGGTSPDELHRPKEIGGHLSAIGHRRVAELLAAQLEELGWIDLPTPTSSSGRAPEWEPS